MAIIGGSLTFLPQEILTYYQIQADIILMVGMQLLGALYLGFAMLNWMSKSNLMGGIYSRPVAIANTMHFTMGGLLFLKQVLDRPASADLLCLTLLYLGFAVIFGIVAFKRSPAPGAC